jgi:5-methylcytosine-specific restriction endonuclease McrA
MRLRARWAPTVERGGCVCSHCGRLIHTGQDWDLDHVVPRADGGPEWRAANIRPAHASCNRAAGARMTHRPTTPESPERPGFL